MSIFQRILRLPKKLFASVLRREPGTYKDTRYLKFEGKHTPDAENAVLAAFVEAFALLRQKGHVKDSRHRIAAVVFVPGTVYDSKKEWAFYDSANGINVAGLCDGREISLAVSPETGDLNKKRGYRDARHEWGHALLFVAHPSWTTEQHHQAMGF